MECRLCKQESKKIIKVELRYDDRINQYPLCAQCNREIEGLRKAGNGSNSKDYEECKGNLKNKCLSADEEIKEAVQNFIAGRDRILESKGEEFQTKRSNHWIAKILITAGVVFVFEVIKAITDVTLGALPTMLVWGLIFALVDKLVKDFYNEDEPDAITNIATIKTVDYSEEFTPGDDEEMEDVEPDDYMDEEEIIETGDAMRFCPYCGTSLTAGARFCAYCGKQLTDLQRDEILEDYYENPRFEQRYISHPLYGQIIDNRPQKMNAVKIPKGKTCPKCGGQMQYQVVSVANHAGCLTIILYFIFALTIIGLLVVIPLLLRDKTKTKTMAVCASCGYRKR